MKAAITHKAKVILGHIHDAKQARKDVDTEAQDGTIQPHPPGPAFADPNLHRTNAGAWPNGGPTPSKLAVVLYYISCTLVIFGTLIFVRSFFDKDQVS